MPNGFGQLCLGSAERRIPLPTFATRCEREAVSAKFSGSHVRAPLAPIGVSFRSVAVAMHVTRTDRLLLWGLIAVLQQLHYSVPPAHHRGWQTCKAFLNFGFIRMSDRLWVCVSHCAMCTVSNVHHPFQEALV